MYTLIGTTQVGEAIVYLLENKSSGDVREVSRDVYVDLVGRGLIG